MKKLLLCVLMLGLLCGCGVFGEKTYVVVEPHDNEYQTEVDSDAQTVSSYLSLKNAMISFVMDGVEEGVLRAESYSGDLSKDLSDAVYEVSRGNPIGAFAVDYMTYDYSKIVSYYEINIHCTYRRTVEEINSIVYVTDTDEIETQLQEAMTDYATVLRLHVGDYREADLSDLVQEIYRAHPEFALEQPDINVASYPDSGTQRVLEIEFLYKTDQETLKMDQEQLQNVVSNIVSLYGSDLDQRTGARRCYYRLGRDGSLTQSGDRVFADSAYGALVEMSATSLGYAQAYTLLMEAQDIPCELVQGTWEGQSRDWCRITLDGTKYYVDPSAAVLDPDTEQFLMTAAELETLGYELNN
jgi:hypothetical protein